MSLYFSSPCFVTLSVDTCRYLPEGKSSSSQNILTEKDRKKQTGKKQGRGRGVIQTSNIWVFTHRLLAKSLILLLVLLMLLICLEERIKTCCWELVLVSLHYTFCFIVFLIKFPHFSESLFYYRKRIISCISNGE